MGIEEEELLVVAAQYLTHVACHHRLELEYIAHKKQLLAAKGFTHVVSIDAQHLVDKVDDIGTHHRYLVDDDEVEFPDELDFLGRVA